MLANGQGKGRAGTDGELRTRKQWRLLFFSTGELSLTEHAAKAGDPSMIRDCQGSYTPAQHLRFQQRLNDINDIQE